MKRTLVAGLFLLALAGTSVHGLAALENEGKQNEPLRLDVSVTANDPFDAANEKKGTSAVLQVRQGQSVKVQITGTPKAGYHTYPLRVPAGQAQNELSEVKVTEVKGLIPVGAIVESPPVPVMHEDKLDGKRTLLEHGKPFTWTQEVRIAAEAPPGRVELPFKVNTLVCNDKQCIPFRAEVRAIFEVMAQEPAATPEVADNRPPAEQPEAVEKPAPANKAEHDPYVGLISVSAEEYQARMEKLAQQIVKNAAPPDAGLLAFILTGIFWGAVSLITPCVFPMIPITVSFFLKQSEKAHHRPVVMASVYSLTIVVVLTLAAAFLLSAFRWLSINPLMNYALGGLFVFFALSLFGMYEIELPSGLARFTSAREGQGGLVGTMFMALTFTIISFACVAPFLGGFGGTAAAARPMWHNLLGGLAFSATFAAPFFFLALFPTLLKAMPKSGSWLNAVKVVMGFLELAAAFKFFRGAELLQSGGEVTFFSFDFVLGIWIALAFLCALYLLGLFRLPHDTPAESIGVPRLLFSVAFIGVGLYLMPALFKVNNEGASQRPGGAVYAWVDAFLLPESRAGGASGKEEPKTGDLQYAVDKAREIQRKTGQPKRIFVDFTGMACTNCRINERDVFSRPEVQQALRQYLGVEIYADRIPVELYSPAVRAALAEDKSRINDDAGVNGTFELKVFDQETLPIYAILEPQADERILIVDFYPQGRISDVADFMHFLTGARAKEKADSAK